MSTAVCMNLKVNGRKNYLPQRLSETIVHADGMDFRAGAVELLHRWPDLGALIQEASKKLRESFGTSARIVLERFDDPETGKEDPSLYLVIETTLKAREARQALDRFEDEWWMDNAARSNDRLHISVEFL